MGGDGAVREERKGGFYRGSGCVAESSFVKFPLQRVYSSFAQFATISWHHLDW